MLGISIISLWLAFLTAIPAQAETTCGKAEASGHAYGWCIDQDPASKSQDVIYYMHGGGGSEQSWIPSEYEKDMLPTWKKLGFDTPIVITFSFGKGWLLGDVATDRHPALLPLVLNEIMPFLESKIGGVKGRRMIMGPSMGGFNTALLSLRAPHLFERAAVLCPGIAAFDPFASDEEIKKYLGSQPSTTDPDLVYGMVDWIRADFQTRENWLRHDAVTLAKAAAGKLPAFYASCTKDDEYGFFEGAKLFAEALSGKTESRWFPMESGGHCAETEESLEALAKFLAGRP